MSSADVSKVGVARLSVESHGVWELSTQQTWVLAWIYDALVRSDRWPTLEEIDYAADRNGLVDPVAVLRSMSPLMIQGIGRDAAPSMSQQINLTVLGLAALEEGSKSARTDLLLLLDSVREAVKIADATEPPAKAKLVGLDFVHRAEGRDPYAATVIRLGLLWSTGCSHLWSLFNGAGTVGWEAPELNQRELRKYRGLTDVPGLVEIERQRHLDRSFGTTLIDVAELGAARSRTARADKSEMSATPDESITASWTALLPDGFRRAVEGKLAVDAVDAIAAGWIVLADLIHARTNLDLDGYELVNRVFNTKDPTIRLSPPTTTGDNLQGAYGHILRGLAQLRNVYMHRGRPDVSPLHAMSVIAMQGECYHVIDVATAQDRHSQGPLNS